VTGGKLELDRTIAEAVADVVILDTGVEGQPERIETAAPKD